MRAPSVKQQLMDLYRSNIAGAQQFGQGWAVDHYRSKLRELQDRGSGPLPAWAKRDVEYFGDLIHKPGTVLP